MSTGGPSSFHTQGGSYPRWSPDGKQLFFFATNAIAAVPFAGRGESPDLGAAVKLFDARAPDGFGRYFYDVAPDGRFLVSVPASEPTSFELTLLVNWQAALRD
jgi:hypothetical protein